MKNKIVQEMLKELLSTVKSLKSVGEKELPLLARDLLEDWVISSWTNIIINSLVVIPGILLALVGYYALTHISDEVGKWIVMGLIELIALGFLGTGIVGIVNQTRDLILAKRAPKAVLLDMISKRLR